MRIIARRTLKEFWEKHPQSKQALISRYTEIVQNKFSSPQKIIQYYPRASIIEGNRVIFRIKGNDYRIVTKINYDYQIIRIRFIGTHQEYDSINTKII